jgi:hypothetical protein
MRYGLIGTAYNMGISHIAEGFASAFNMKTLIAHYKPYAIFPERFEHHRITQNISAADLEWLLSDIDILMAIETPYNWGVFAAAKARGIKVVFLPMIEWLDRKRPELRMVDLFICAAQYTQDRLPKGSRSVVVPSEVPIDTSAFTRYQSRSFEKIRTFLHIAGHGGIGGRNSTAELLEAIPLVKNRDVRFIIRSQVLLPKQPHDPRVTFIEGNVREYTDLYAQGDAWIMPWKYGVYPLGLGESMAAGMLPIITDMEPFDDYVRSELLLKPKELIEKTIHAGQRELYAIHDPMLIARKIDEVADISPEYVKGLRAWAKKTADAMSWNVWKEKYEAIFASL